MEYKFNGFLYKGINGNILSLDREVPTWFALEKETCKKYGKYIFEIETELKLLDITTWSFRNELFDRLNKYVNIKINQDLKRLKSISLMALGLPNLNAQIEFIKIYLSKIPNQYQDQHMFLDTCTLIGHRLSDKQIDLNLVELLMLLYPEFDGYIQPYKVASCWMNEFASEVCIFNMCKHNFKKSKKIINNQSAGSINDPSYRVWQDKFNDTMFNEKEFKKDMEYYRKLLNSKIPIEDSKKIHEKLILSWMEDNNTIKLKN